LYPPDASVTLPPQLKRLSGTQIHPWFEAPRS
jgi:hypothetical protein